MSKIIETRCFYHLGDNIINFIFFYKKYQILLIMND